MKFDNIFLYSAFFFKKKLQKILMSLQKGHFEYVGHGVTWVPHEEPDIKTIPTQIEITKKLEQEVKYYKNLTETLKSQLEYYKNKVHTNGLPIPVGF